MLLEHFIKAMLLNKGRLEIILQRFPQFRKEIERFKREDQEGNLKYLLWQVKQLERKEPANEIISLIDQFHKMKDKLKQKIYSNMKRLVTCALLLKSLAKKKR